MKTPFEILDVAEDANDAEVKTAYLAMVRQYPPERAPQQFQRIRKAYEAIRSEEDRLAYGLFHCEMPDEQDVYEIFLGKVSPQRPDSAKLQEIMSHCLQQFQLPKKVV